LRSGSPPAGTRDGRTNGSEDRSIPTLNLACLLDHQTRLTPDRPAIICRPHELSYARLEAAAGQVAAGLRAIGLRAGDHIGLSCPNTLHFPIAYYGILKLGGVVVPFNVLFKPREIASQLADSGAKALIVFEGAPELPMAQMARAACDAAKGCGHLIVMTMDPAAPSPVERSLTLGQLMRGQPEQVETHPAAPGDTAVILYTSGTTGQPKGAELTHLNLTLNAMASRDMLAPMLEHGPGAGSVTLVTLPLFHSTGQTAQLNAGMAGGWTLVLMPRFDPAAVLRAFETERVSSWIGVPTMYWALLHYARTAGLDVSGAAASLRCCVSGGAPLPAAVLEDFERTFGVRILEGYGLSETSPVACFNQAQKPSKPGTVGFPIAGCEIRVVDAHDHPLPAGARGEIVIRGSNVMKGYYKRPVETAEALRGGWLHTGDIGVFDEDGYLTIVDRKKDLVLRGGMNVYPREVEDVLMTHPAVSLAAVIGVPDERLGEDVKAFVVLKPGASTTAEALIAWSREQLAAYKYPRIIEFRDALPVGPTGKVFKRDLRPQASGPKP
jgi:long-chain acyl-CoA synthetase